MSLYCSIQYYIIYTIDKECTGNLQAPFLHSDIQHPLNLDISLGPPYGNNNKFKQHMLYTTLL